VSCGGVAAKIRCRLTLHRNLVLDVRLRLLQAVVLGYSPASFPSALTAALCAPMPSKSIYSHPPTSSSRRHPLAFSPAPPSNRPFQDGHYLVSVGKRLSLRTAGGPPGARRSGDGWPPGVAEAVNQPEDAAIDPFSTRFETSAHSRSAAVVGSRRTDDDQAAMGLRLERAARHRGSSRSRRILPSTCRLRPRIPSPT